MNKNVEFLYKLLNEFYLQKGTASNDSIDVRRVLGDLINFGDTDKERYVNIMALSNVYCMLMAKANFSNFVPGMFYKCDDSKVKSQLGVTYFAKNLLEADSYIPMYLKLALEDILNFLWNPKVLNREVTYNDINVNGSSLDLYLNSAVDEYTRYREALDKDIYNIPMSEVKVDSLKVRKDSNGEIMIMEPSLEFTLLLNKFNIEYIISLLIILTVALITAARNRV